MNSSPQEAEAPSLPAGEKSSGKSAKVVRTLQEPLNPHAPTIPATLSQSPVAEATVRQVSTDDVDAPTDVRYNDTNLGHAEQRDVAQEEQAELVRREKQAGKERKAGSRRIRDAARLAASLAQTRDIGTPRAAGTRSSVQTTCMDGLMPTGADGQAAAGQGALANRGGGELTSEKENQHQRMSNWNSCRSRAVSEFLRRRRQQRRRLRAGAWMS